MADKKYFDEQTLDLLEQKLWRIIENSVFNDETLPPHISTLIDSDACEEYRAALDAYAWDSAHNEANDWEDHPLFDHLTYCTACQQHLQEMIAFYTKAPHIRRRTEQDVDITLLYKQLPQKDDLDVRSIADANRPVLLDVSILEHPPGWYYSLEQTRQAENGPSGFLLSLINPAGSAANISVRMVLLGRILHGITNENGQIFFEGIEMQTLTQPQIPAVTLHLRFPA